MLELDLAFDRQDFSLTASLSLPERVCVLAGPSGCGKTTLLDLIAGLLTPRRGWIRLDGETLVDRERDVCLSPEQRRIGYLFQEDMLFPHLSVAGNLRYGWKRRGGKGIALEEVVEVLGLGELLERRPSQLSGGERRRTALGRALLAAPRLLLLDEPLANLDETLRERILSYLLLTVERFRVPLLYVSHDPVELARLSPRILRMERGRLDPGAS